MVETSEKALTFPTEKGKQVSYTISPNEKVFLEGVNFETMRVDVLGQDIIITDPETGSQMILLGLTAFLFDEETAPTLVINGIEVSATEILSYVGEVGNLTVKDFIAISSIFPENDLDETSGVNNPLLGGAQDETLDGEGQGLAEGGEEGEGEEETGEKDSSEDMTSILYNIASSINSGQFDTEFNFQDDQPVEEFKSNAPPVAIDEEGDSFNVSPEESSSSSSAVSSSEDVAVFDPPPEPEQPQQFEVRLLQIEDVDGIESIMGVDTRVVRGGGGSDASFSNPANESQFSTEIIDASTDNSGVIVYADNPDNFTPTLMTRIIEIEPQLGAGFAVDRITISDFPSGYSVINGIADGSSYYIENPVFNERGAVQFVLQYEVPDDRDFEIGLRISAEFDEDLFVLQSPDADLVVPLETSIELIEQLMFKTRDVFGPTDYNFTNSEGDLIYVLANTTNNNRIFTGDGNDTIYGGLANDVINAAGGDDFIDASDGNDTIIGGRGDDHIIAGSGDDIIRGEEGIDHLDYSDEISTIDLNLNLLLNNFATATIDEFGPDFEQDLVRGVENITTGSGADILGGNSFNNVLITSGGEDLILASEGQDEIDGGTEIDTIDYSTLNGLVNFISVTLNDGVNATVTIDGGDNDLVRNVENIIGTSGGDTLFGDTQINILEGRAGDDSLYGGGANDTLDGGSGSDTVNYSLAAGGVTINLANNQTTIDGDGGADTLISIENATGSNLADNITGSALANIFDGLGGNDTILGGGGDDIFLASDDADTLDGQGDTDTVDYSTLAGVNFINADLDGAADSTIIVDGGTNDTVRNIENVIGTSGNDTISGDALDNVLTGSGGNDTLSGEGGADTLDGGTGTDTADYSAAAAEIDVDLSLNRASDDGDGGQDTLNNIENVTGSINNDVISGNSGVNLLSGNDGDDRLYGAGGVDTLDGGDGDDAADYSDASAAVNVNLLAGVASNDGDGANDILSNIENVTGSVHNDVIAGDNDANILSGNDGADTINGGGGNDTLQGDAGDDTLDGGDGDDIHFGGNGGDTLLSSAGIDTFDGGANNDTVDYSGDLSVTAIAVTLNSVNNATVTVTGGANDILRSIENVTATAGDDQVTGDIFANVINGLGGNDVIRGGAGADTLDGGDGTDELRFDELTGLGIALNIANLSAVYQVDSSIDTFSNFESYFTTLQDDTITGSANADIVSTLNGNDLVVASAGTDTLDGGFGSDTISYTNLVGANFIAVLLNDGAPSTVNVDGGDNDTIVNFENVVGTVGDDLIGGNSEDNTLEGSIGDDILYGGGGIDILDGGVGNDEANYSVAAGTVVVNLAAGEASVDGDGASDSLISIENVTGSSNNDTIIGNGVANILIAGDGNDVVSGGAGSDNLQGGLGVDELRFDDLTGVGVTLNLSTGTALYSVDGSTDTFSGFEEYYTTNQADTITGSASADLIYGLQGNDTFIGSAGADELYGGDQSDTLDYSGFSAANNISATLNDVTQITVSINGLDDDLAAEFENIIGSQGDDILNGDANANTIDGHIGDDVIRGGSGSDTLTGGAGTDQLRFDDLSGTGIEINIGAGTAFFGGDNSTDNFSLFEEYYISAQDDIIRGSSNVDTVFALAGDDTFFVSEGADILDGGSDNDSADYSSLDSANFITVNLNGAGDGTVLINGRETDTVRNIENIIATSGNDILNGDDQINILNGLAGDDTINGGGGDDQILAGAGNDTILASDDADTIDGESGTDTIDYSSLGATFISTTLNGSTFATVSVAGGTNDTVRNVENVIGTSGNDIIRGDSNNNELSGNDGNDFLSGGGGTDILRGDAGIDTADYTNALVGIVVDLGAGVASNDGDGGSDTLVAIENIRGSSNNDTITGSATANLLEGGAGSDTFFASAGNDTIDGQGDLTDTMNYSNLAGITSVEFTLNGAIDATVTVTGGDNDTLRNVENVIGSVGDDTMRGDVNANRLEGFTGNDTLVGRGGSDVLVGGDGVDIADYSLAVGAVSVSLLGGVASNDGDGSSDTLFTIENIRGSSQNDTLHGDNQANTIFGGNGADTIRGYGGNDIFEGGAGADTADYSDADAAVTVDISNSVTSNDGDGGSDTLNSIENISGSTFDDNITGDGGNNTLSGNDGNDRLVGLGGTDNLDGGLGIDVADYSASTGTVVADLLAGTASNDGLGGTDVFTSIESLIGSNQGDILRGDNIANNIQGGAGDDSIRGRGGADTLDGGAGIDTADYAEAANAVTVDLSNNQASNDGDFSIDTLLNFENIQGSVNDDDLTGDGDDNVISGGVGDDRLVGLGGDDTLDGEDGTDTADYSNANAGITANMLLGTVSDDGDGGSDTLIEVENITGSAFADTIFGDNAVNVLSGLGGNDTLRGNNGNDTLDGGSGTDTADYSIAAGSVIVDLLLSQATNDGGGNTDTLISIENVTGSLNNDTLRGNADNNTLSGLAGDDILRGNAGDDTLIGGAGTDTTDYTTALGAVTVNLAASTASDGEGGTDTLSQIENILGSGNDDTLSGDGNANTIDGQGGNDTLYGAGGVDVLDGGAGTDEVTYALAAAGVTVDLSGAVSNDGDGSTDTLISIENATGSNFDDTITGSLVGNVINAGGGNDVLSGGGGADTLNGGAGINTVNYGNAAGAVTLSLLAGTATNDGDGASDTLTNIQNVIGSDFADAITGGSTTNLIEAGDGNDTITASAGADIIDGQADIDTITYNGVAGVTGISVVLTESIDATVTVTGGSNDIIRNIENVTGSVGNDNIRGDGETNIIDGAGGNDTIYGGAGSDTFIGGAGTDTLRFDDLTGSGVVLNLATLTADYGADGSTNTFSGFEDYYTTNLDDVITGSGFTNDIVFGLGGDDTFNASAGNDTFDGGTNGVNADTIDYTLLAANFITVTLNGSNAATVVVDGGDNDTITNIENVIGTTGNDTIIGDDLVNTLDGGIGNDTITGGGGNDILNGGAGDDLFFGSAGQNTINGGANIDTVNYSTQTGIGGISVILDGAGLATVSISGGTNDLVQNVENVTGTSSGDVITGDDADNIFLGLGGNDFFAGGEGADTMDGGAGANDWVRYHDGFGAGVNSISVTLNGASDATVTVDGQLNDIVRNIENVQGSDGNDTIIGDSLDNELYGEDGNDLIIGNAGADIIHGGNGIDTIDYSLDVSATSISVTLDRDNLQTVSIGGGDNDQIRSVENVIGTSGNDYIVGDGLVNDIFGGDGNDTIGGRGGLDILDGGDGNDTFLLSYTAANINLDASNLDVDGYFTTSQGAKGRNFENITGSLGVNIITGDSGDNILSALSGNDTVNGGAGNDTIDGGSGEDILNGGEGNDIINGGVDDDTIIASIGTDTINGGADVDGLDIDTLDYSTHGTTSISVTLNGSTAATVTIAGGTGNHTVSNIESIIATSGNDTLEGDSGDNYFLAGDGDDTIIWSAGEDEWSGEGGIDTLDLSTATSAVSMQALTLISGSYAVNVGGIGTLADGFELIEGSDFSDSLRGDSTMTLINGNGGNDTLLMNTSNSNVTGGTGNDTIYIGWNISSSNVLAEGNDGNDSFIRNAGNSQIIDGGDGVDTLRFYESSTGAVTVDLAESGDTNVQLASVGDDTIRNIENIVGGNFNDDITGNTQINVLSGNDGNDRIGASLGADTYNGDVGSDTVDYSVLNGSITSIAVNLTATGNTTVTLNGVTENHTINTIENIIGTNGDDIVTGSTEDNSISLGLGNDIIYVSEGEDNLDGGGGTDQLRLDNLSFSGNDLDLEAGVININGVNQIIAGFEEYYLTNQNDTIESSSGVDTIFALDGDDTVLLSTGGNDIIDGGDGTDTMDYTNYAGPATVDLGLGTATNLTSFISFENVIGSNLADTITGDANANVINGGASADILDGGAGIDILLGGAGDDTLISRFEGETLDGGEGSETNGDTVDYSAFTASTLTINLSIAGGGASAPDNLLNIENIIGSTTQINMLTDSTDNNRLVGGNLDDVFFAQNGTDVDTFEGGAGTDTIDFSNNSSVNINFATNGETLTSIELINGTSGNDTIINNDDGRIIEGGAGNDILGSGNGIDTLNGGAGNDTILVTTGGNDIVDGGSGTNTLDYTNYTGNAVVNLGTSSASNLASFSNFVNITGSSNADVLTGDANANVINGGGGDDTINGGGGNDTLVGGTGNDTLDGGAGTDSLNGGAGNDTLIGLGQGEILDGGEGSETTGDTINYSAYASSVIVNLSIIGGGASAPDTVLNVENVIGSLTNSNIFTESSDNNHLTGGNLNDSFFAQVGNGTDIFDGGTGTDTVDYSLASSISLNLLTNADTLNSIEIVRGTSGNDTIINDNTGRTIEAGSGNDTITGGTGTDTLLGQDGNDTFFITSGNDTLDGGNNVDTLNYSTFGSSATVNLGTSSATGVGSLSNFENITGSANADNLTGNGFGNTIIGGAGNDTIDGGTGLDSLDGGAGDDTLVGRIENETLDGGSGSEVAGDTADYSSYGSSISAATFTAGGSATFTNGGNTDTLNNFENFTLSGSGDTINIDTNAMSDFSTIDGSAGNDTVNINGLGGNSLTAQGLDGVNMAALFTDIETLDFTNTDLTGGDTFDIDNDNIDALTNLSGGDLSILLDLSTISFTDVNVSSVSGASISSDTTIAGVSRTVSWDNGTELVLQSA